MPDDRNEAEPAPRSMPVFVISCVIGFAIIVGCVFYFITRFFL